MGRCTASGRRWWRAVRGHLASRSEPGRAVFSPQQTRLHSPSNRPSACGDPVGTRRLPTLHTSMSGCLAFRSLVGRPRTARSLSSEKHSTDDVRAACCRHPLAPPSSSIRTDPFRRGVCSRHRGRRQATSDTVSPSIHRVLHLRPSPPLPSWIASSASIHPILRRHQLVLPTRAIQPDRATRLDHCLP
jgi:hypothetical protein